MPGPLLRQISAALVVAALLQAPWLTRTALADGDPIRVATSDLPPLSMEHVPGKPGALHELVQELSRRTQIPLRVEFVPWQRGMFMATHLSRTAIFPLTRTSEREDQFRWLAKLYHERFIFLGMKGKVDLSDIERLKPLRIGILRGSAQIKTLREMGFTHVIEASSVHEELRFLRGGMVSAIMGDTDIFRDSIKQDRYPEADFIVSEPVRTTTTWLGGSLDISDAEEAAFQAAMKSMVDDGSYARILKAYDLTP